MSNAWFHIITKVIQTKLANCSGSFVSHVSADTKKITKKLLKIRVKYSTLMFQILMNKWHPPGHNLHILEETYSILFGVAIKVF